MACKREDRFRRNTIAFWLSDEEKSQVEAKIILSGISKGEYYRKLYVGQGGKSIGADIGTFTEWQYRRGKITAGIGKTVAGSK